jgi:hypothetical protein
MKAIFNDNTSTNGINVNHRKEKGAGFQKQLTAVYIDGGEITEAAILRTYATASFNTWSACVWLFSGTWTSASASASGYGYCKQSAAAAQALHKLGFEFEEPIFGGVGMYTIEKAFQAAAEALTGKPCQVITAHA